MKIKGISWTLTTERSLSKKEFNALWINDVFISGVNFKMDHLAHGMHAPVRAAGSLAMDLLFKDPFQLFFKMTLDRAQTLNWVCQPENAVPSYSKVNLKFRMVIGHNHPGS